MSKHDGRSFALSMRLVGVWMVLAHAASAQAGQPGTNLTIESPAAMMDKLKRDDAASLSYVEPVVRAKRTDAIPILEAKFVSSHDSLDKGKIAQGLIRLGDKKDLYWDYLVELAKPVVDSNAPSPLDYDPSGKTIAGLSPRFVEWANSSNLPIYEAGEDAIYIQPGKIMLLGATGDSRAIPLLRKALTSRSPLIQSAASMGLAEIRDATSVPLIIEACRRAPSEAASLIASSLVYFDDPQAQVAVDTYLTSKDAAFLRNARLQGKRPFS